VTALTSACSYAALLSIIVACIPPLQEWLETVKPVVGCARADLTSLARADDLVAAPCARQGIAPSR
jgi:hypothetical protein